MSRFIILSFTPLNKSLVPQPILPQSPLQTVRVKPSETSTIKKSPPSLSSKYLSVRRWKDENGQDHSILSIITRLKGEDLVQWMIELKLLDQNLRPQKCKSREQIKAYIRMFNNINGRAMGCFKLNHRSNSWNYEFKVGVQRVGRTTILPKQVLGSLQICTKQFTSFLPTVLRMELPFNTSQQKYYAQSREHDLSYLIDCQKELQRKYSSSKTKPQRPEGIGDQTAEQFMTLYGAKMLHSQINKILMGRLDIHYYSYLLMIQNNFEDTPQTVSTLPFGQILIKVQDITETQHQNVFRWRRPNVKKGCDLVEKVSKALDFPSKKEALTLLKNLQARKCSSNYVCSYHIRQYTQSFYNTYYPQDYQTYMGKNQLTKGKITQLLLVRGVIIGILNLRQYGVALLDSLSYRILIKRHLRPKINILSSARIICSQNYPIKDSPRKEDMNKSGSIQISERIKVEDFNWVDISNLGYFIMQVLFQQTPLKASSSPSASLLKTKEFVPQHFIKHSTPIFNHILCQAVQCITQQPSQQPLLQEILLSVQLALDSLGFSFMR